MDIIIDDDLADKITVQNLLDSYKLNQELSQELMAKDSLENYEAVDLANQLKIIRHIHASRIRSVYKRKLFILNIKPLARVRQD